MCDMCIHVYFFLFPSREYTLDVYRMTSVVTEVSMLYSKGGSTVFTVYMHRQCVFLRGTEFVIKEFS